jgi:hypothetical protein
VVEQMAHTHERVRMQPSLAIRVRWPVGALIGLALAMTAACGDPSGPAAPGSVGDSVSVTFSGGQIALANHTDSPVFIHAGTQYWAVHSDWVACVYAVGCSPLAAGATRSIPVPSNPNGIPTGTVIVSWWHAVAGPGGVLRPDSIRVVLITP